MELRAYWELARRRWLLLLLPAAVVLVIGLAAYRPPDPVYHVGVRFIVGQAPSEAAFESDEERLANWHASEYIVNGLTDWVRGGQFAGLVSDYLAGRGVAVPPPVIQGSLAADNVRSTMTVEMVHGDRALLEAMIRGVVAVLVADNALGLPHLGGQPAVVNPIDEPVINEIRPGIRSQLDLFIRLGAALAVGVGLALLVDYLDPTVRSRQELEKLGLSVLGEIPKE